jgi:DNA-binding IclR family transcriptional regulator
MSLSDASESLGVPKSTLLGSLKALVADGFLISEGGSYFLGPGAYRLAGSIMAAWSMPDLVRPYVRGLAEATRESVGFGVVDWEIGQIIYTDAVNSPQPVHYAMRVGVRAPLYASAAGRVLLAFAPEDRVADYLRRTRFKALTESTVTGAEQLKEQLVDIRLHGHCTSLGELLRDSGAVAAPVFDPRGEVVGALMVGAPLERMRDNIDALLGAVRSFARQASGFDPDDDEPLAAA